MADRYANLATLKYLPQNVTDKAVQRYSIYVVPSNPPALKTLFALNLSRNLTIHAVEDKPSSTLDSQETVKFPRSPQSPSH